MTEPSISPHGDSRSPFESGSTYNSPSLRKRIGTVAVASVFALIAGQLLSLAQTVALARLLSPTEVGYFAAGSVVTSFMSNFVEGGLRAGLIHREDRIEDAAEIVFRATLVTGLMMSLFALSSAPVISVLFDSRTAGVVAASMAGGILLFSLTNVPEALLQREFSVKRRLIVGPAVAFTFAVVSVTLAALGLGVWSLVIGTYASSTVWVGTLWWLCDWRPSRGKTDFKLYREMVRYGLPMAISLFADHSVKSVQAIVTGRFLSVNSLGLFRYSERMAQIPVGAIVEVGANSLFPAYSRISSDPTRFRRAYLHALGLVVVVAAAISGLLLAVGVPLVVIVLGDEWRGAGLALVAMAGLGVGTAISTSAEAIKGAGRTTLLNWVTLVETILGIGLVVALAPLWGLVGVGLSISLTSLVSGIMLLTMARKIVDVHWRSVLSTVLPPVVSALAATLVIFVVEHEVFISAERPLALGLLLLVTDCLAFLCMYAIVLRLAAPASFGLITDLVGSLLTAARGRLTSVRSRG